MVAFKLRKHNFVGTIASGSGLSSKSVDRKANVTLQIWRTPTKSDLFAKSQDFISFTLIYDYMIKTII